MKADALTPRDLFDGKVQFEIPSFQRPYVWNEEDQWAPLWADIKRVATRLIEADSADDRSDPLSHFLGAIVIKELSHQAGDVARSAVIDGQQRMTTLQILLDAAQAAVATAGNEEEAEALGELILNSANRFAGTTNRFKLWPSRADREAFAAAMDDVSSAVPEHRITEAHTFFADEIARWLAGDADEDEAPVGSGSDRAAALTDVLQVRLRLVAINLGAEDDDQLIFETLNDRGTPLLAADLIKNWVFQRGADLGADVDEWADTHWAEMDEEWWRKEITQGRYMRSRVDIFLQYWLTMRMRDEIASDGVFRRFTEHALECMPDAQTADAFLAELKRDANTFRSFAQLDPDTPAGRYYARVVEAFELAATTPVLLWMLSENHRVPDSEVDRALSALESWVIRRTMLRMTMKDVNKLMVAMLNSLDVESVDSAGATVRGFLAGQTADARVWPTDEEMEQGLPEIRLYGNVRQGRLRVVLQGVERLLRTEKHEDTALPPTLEIEHIMPRAWQTYWDEDPPIGPEDAAARSKLVNTLGNLTLVTQKLNGSMSHRPWTDAEAAVVAPTGKQAGRGKRSLLDQYSLLVLNKVLIQEHQKAWTEADIRERSLELTRRICEAWPSEARPVEAPKSSTPAGPETRVADRLSLIAALADEEAGSADAAEAILDWADAHPDLEITWNKAGDIGFGRGKSLLRLWGGGTLEVKVHTLRKLDLAWDDDKRIAELLQRLEGIEGVDFSGNRKQWPRAPLSSLAEQGKREAFLDILGDVVQGLEGGTA